MIPFNPSWNDLYIDDYYRALYPLYWFEMKVASEKNLLVVCEDGSFQTILKNKKKLK